MVFSVTEKDWWSLLTLHAREGILLQHIPGVTLTPEGAYCVNTDVVADVALIYEALIHILHLNRTLHRILPILVLTNGEGLSTIRAVRYYSTRREQLLLSQVMAYHQGQNLLITCNIYMEHSSKGDLFY